MRGKGGLWGLGSGIVNERGNAYVYYKVKRRRRKGFVFSV